MLAFTLCISLLGSVLLANCQKVVVLNSLVDILINESNRVKLSSGHDRISIPNVIVSFVKKILIVRVQGSFEFTEGWLQHLSTLHRTGNATLTTTPSGVILHLRLGFQNFSLGFDHYEAKVLGIAPTGKLDVTIARNSIDCQISLDFNYSVCASTVKQIIFNQFSGIEVHITGFGILDSIFSKTATLIANLYGNKIKLMMESKVKTAMNTAMTESNLCSMFTELF